MTQVILTDIIGYTAAVVGTMLMLPQVIKSWRTKQVDDLSFAMVILYFANCALWLAYGLLVDVRPVVLTNAISMVISVVLLGLKLRYRTVPSL
jgi:MtN3 and saliva related transmembrane protein